MNEQLRKSSERFFPSSRDYSRSLMNDLENRADHPEAFYSWQVALGDIVELLKLEQKKNAAEATAAETNLKTDKLKAAKETVKWNWKLMSNEGKGVSPEYRSAYMRIRLAAFQMEMAHEIEEHENPPVATIGDLEKLNEYAKRLHT